MTPCLALGGTMGLTPLGLSLRLGHHARQKGLMKSSTSFQNYLLQPGLRYEQDACRAAGEAQRGAWPKSLRFSSNLPGKGPGVGISVSQVMLRCIQKASHPLMHVLLEGGEPTACTTVLPGDQKSER